MSYVPLIFPVEESDRWAGWSGGEWREAPAILRELREIGKKKKKKNKTTQVGREGTVLLYYWIPSEKVTDRPYASMIICAHISWWGKKKQTYISKTKDGITGHESKRLMSCQKKMHSSVKYTGKCLIAVKSMTKRSDECVFLQQRELMLSEKSSLLRKITLHVLLWFAHWEWKGLL